MPNSVFFVFPFYSHDIKAYLGQYSLHIVPHITQLHYLNDPQMPKNVTGCDEKNISWINMEIACSLVSHDLAIDVFTKKCENKTYLIYKEEQKWNIEVYFIYMAWI